MTATNTDNLPTRSTQSTFGLRFIFGIVIGCSFFFALFSFSPAMAIGIAAIATPALIRTGNIENLYRFHRHPFDWRDRTGYFVHSVGLMITTALLATAAFAATCIVCAILGYGFAKVFDSSLNAPRELAFIGATGGAVWGITTALVAIGWYWNRNWLPEIDFRAGEESL